MSKQQNRSFTSITAKIIGFILLVLSGQNVLQAQTGETKTRHFNGFYTGVEVGQQNIFGGAFIAGNDILSESTRFTASGLLGWRRQLKNGLVFGLEGQLGITDGDLAFNDSTLGLSIAYENNSQAAYGVTMGYAFGTRKNWHAFLYGYGVSRNFDIKISGPLGSGTQRDNQGFIRYGIGLEKALSRRVHIRGSAGTLTVDFGDLPTNIDVEGKIDATLSLLIQF